MHIDELVDETTRKEAIAGRLVNTKERADGKATIHFYSKVATYIPGAFDNPYAKVARGLITDKDGNIIARPWGKFFNHVEKRAGELDPDALVEVTDKMDGSLGVVYVIDGEVRIATKGSFDSTQADEANKILSEKGYTIDPAVASKYTMLLEIVYPEGRIVLDYGQERDLYLLGAVETETARAIGPLEAKELFNWQGPTTEVLATGITYREALQMADREGAEGTVVRFLDHNQKLVKIKQPDYVQLHRLVTGMDPNMLWINLAMNDVAASVGWDEEKARKALKLPRTYTGEIYLGDDWRERLLGALPDEIHAWCDDVLEELETKHSGLREMYEDKADRFHGLTPREVFEDTILTKEEKHRVAAIISGATFRMLATLWRDIEPEKAEISIWQSRGQGDKS